MSYTPDVVISQWLGFLTTDENDYLTVVLEQRRDFRNVPTVFRLIQTVPDWLGEELLCQKQHCASRRKRQETDNERQKVSLRMPKKRASNYGR